jgi:HTH-type transcriptional regulator, sugar sensing transcriptional regulator
MANLEVLKSVGLTGSEIKVYLALLELGSSSTGPIVEKSQIASSKIYEVLEKLMQKGLVSFVIESGTKQYMAASPDRIRDYLEERKKQIQKHEEDLNSLIPELKLKQTIAQNKTEAVIFRGIKGAETAFSDVLKTLNKGEEYYVMGSSDPSPSFLRFIRKYHKKRADKGIKVKLLYSKSAMKWAENIKDIALTKQKFAPEQLFSSSFVLMYKDKTLITVVSENDVTLFRIESKEVTDSFVSQFHLLWDQDTRILRGVDAVQLVFEEMLDFGKADFIGARGYFVDSRPKFIDQWEKKAKKKRFKMRNIVDPGAKGHRITKFPFAKTKYHIPKEFSALSVFWIFGNKVVISSWSGEEPRVIVIEDKAVYNLYKKQFELMWKKNFIKK